MAHTTLVFDTETTGIPLWNKPSDDPRQPHLVELACSLIDEHGVELHRYDTLVAPEVDIPPEMTAIHGITTEQARRDGVSPGEAFDNFVALARTATRLVGHRVAFDMRVMRIAGVRAGRGRWEPGCPTFDTAWAARGRAGKLPTLSELVWNLFRERLPEAHRARADCDATIRAYIRLQELRRGRRGN